MSGTRLARRIGVLFGVAALVLLATFTVSIAITGQNRESSTELVDRIGPSRRLAGDLLTALVEQQNAIRGYALRGEELSLLEYRRQLDRQVSSVAELRALLPSDPALWEGLDTTLLAADRWRRDAAEPIIAAVAQRGPRPPEDELYQVEQQRSGPLVAAAESLRADLQQARDSAAGRLTTLDRLEMVMLAVSALVVAGTLLAAVLLLRRWVSTPLAMLAADARQVAGGDYEHRVGVGRAPPEIADTAADVDAMRRRIVEDRDVLAALAVDLQRSNQDLEQFAFVASHDLQEPLRKVSSFCQLLQRRYGGQLDERADQYIEFAVDGAQRMQQLINDLLAFSRVGRTTAGFVPVELSEVVASVSTQLDAAHERSGGEFVVGELPVISGDPALLALLMVNLLGNGLKFARPGVPPRIEIGSRSSEDGWEVWVSDNGIGIDSEYADKVFLIFQRLHSREAYAGTGIGLALAKKIVEFHGGRIWLDTERSRSAESVAGATVRIWFPALEQEVVQ